ncbi:hypothetical protein MKZ25_19795 [Solibacillus sp. FSL W7-1464]|uniref:hypothetical protein n=1 Tax=Solibacillus sp. FSL W7-1464 TaxID=2921706 RepID=UPI0030FA4B06
MNREAIKNHLKIILSEQEDGKISSKEAYILLIQRMDLSENVLNELYIDKKGYTKSKFKVKVQAAVESLRKENILLRGGQRGVWKINK